MCFVSDGIVKWRIYSGEELLSRFSVNDRKEIAGDISTDEEWGDFLKSYPQYVTCYVLEHINTSTDIAFVYLYHESHNVVSIHGGGWSQPLLYYRGYILIIRTFLEKGYKVRTNCNLDNPTAICFSRSVGFIPYRYENSTVYMWISDKTLKRTFLYKRFYLPSL